MTPWNGSALVIAFILAAVAAGHWALATSFTAFGVLTALMLRRVL